MYTSERGPAAFAIYLSDSMLIVRTCLEELLAVLWGGNVMLGSKVACAWPPQSIPGLLVRRYVYLSHPLSFPSAGI